MSRRRKSGRSASPDTPTPEEAIEGLIKLLGPFTESGLFAGCHSYLWENPDGDGLVLVRLSGRDIQQGETAAGQYAVSEEALKRIGKTWRYVLVAIGLSGGNDPEERPDLARIRQAIAYGEVSWVAARDADRLGRLPATTAPFYRLLEKTKTDLFLTGVRDTRMDWEADAMLLNAYAMVGDQERRAIRERTWGANLRYYFNEGKGHSGSGVFGFVRDARRNLVVDEQEWSFVEAIHYSYAEARQGRGHGLRGLQEQLAEMGCELSFCQIRRILRNPIYVTGEYYATHPQTKDPVLQTPIAIANPIPLEVFECNQRLLGVATGRNSKTPIGAAVLNRVDFVHATCMNLEAGQKGHGARLRCYVSKPGEIPAYYRHSPAAPCCKGWRIPRVDVEHAVITTLLELAENELLQEEWIEAARPDQKVGGGPSASELFQTRQTLRQLQSSLAEIEAQQISKAELGVSQDITEMVAATAPLRRRIREAERQLQVAEIIESQTEQMEVQVQSPRELMEALREVLTLEVPWNDPDLMVRRQALVHAALDRVVVYDTEDGGFELELFGPLVPAQAPTLSLGSPGPADEARCEPGNNSWLRSRPKPRITQPFDPPTPEGSPASQEDRAYWSYARSRVEMVGRAHIRHSWRSPRITVHLTQPVHHWEWTFERVEAALYAAQREMAPTPICLHRYRAFRQGRTGYPCPTTIMNRAGENGTSATELIARIRSEFLSEWARKAAAEASDLLASDELPLEEFFLRLFALSPRRRNVVKAYISGCPESQYTDSSREARYAFNVALRAAVKDMALTSVDALPRRAESCSDC